MKIIPPIQIDGSKVLSNNVPEPSMGEIVWIPHTSYNTGDIRIRIETHRKYQALVNINSTVSTPPEEDIARWKDIGPTNSFAMFDYDRNTASINPNLIRVVVKPGKRASSVLIFGLLADEVRVIQRATTGGPVSFDQTFDTRMRNVSSWTNHFYAEFIFRESLVLMNIAPFSAAEFEIVLTKSAGDVQVESIIFGSPVDLGLTQYGAESDILDFSRVERDAFGSATLVPRKNVPKLNATVLVRKADVPAIRKLRQDYAARPLVFLGVEDGQDQYFDALSLVGIFKRMPILVEYPEHSVVTIEAEGI